MLHQPLMLILQQETIIGQFPEFGWCDFNDQNAIGKAHSFERFVVMMKTKNTQKIPGSLVRNGINSSKHFHTSGIEGKWLHAITSFSN